MEQIKVKDIAEEGWYVAEDIRTKLDNHDYTGLDFLLGKLTAYVDITMSEPLAEALMVLEERKEAEACE